MRNSDNVGKGGLRLLKAQQRKPTTEETTNAESSLHLCEDDLDHDRACITDERDRLVFTKADSEKT